MVFEPHTFSWRNRGGLIWYDTVFAGVEQVLLLPPPAHGADGHDQVNQAEIAARIAAAGVSVTALPDGAAVIAEIDRMMSERGVVLLLSSGPLDGLAETLPAYLDARFG